MRIFLSMICSIIYTLYTPKYTPGARSAPGVYDAVYNAVDHAGKDAHTPTHPYWEILPLSRGGGIKILLELNSPQPHPQKGALPETIKKVDAPFSQF